jgi:hypothetical protein
MLDLFIPTLARQDRLANIQAQIDASTTYPHRVWFIVERHDLASIDACKDNKLFCIINHRSPTYAGAINSAWDCLQPDLFFAGADDLVFSKDWDIKALEKINDHAVVGTNDLHNHEVMAGEHATHYLIRGDYIKSSQSIDGEPVLPECYSHNFTDREFVGIAKFRGQFVPCLESVVEHLHFTFGLSKMDATYKKTRLGVDQDQKLYEQRRVKWNRM